MDYDILSINCHLRFIILKKVYNISQHIVVIGNIRRVYINACFLHQDNQLTSIKMPAFVYNKIFLVFIKNVV